MSTNKRAADALRVRDDEALLDRRYFSVDPERWAAFQAAVPTKNLLLVGIVAVAANDE